MEDPIHEKNGNCIYILNVLKKYSDVDNQLKIVDIQRKIKEIYDVDIDNRTIRRNIKLLKEKLNYDILTREDTGKGYYISRDPDTDFEVGELRAIIDTFSYSIYSDKELSKSIINKCKNLQSVYENEKIKNYKVYSVDNKTENKEVVKNIEDITDGINQKVKIEFDYWKYTIDKKFEFSKIKSYKVTPYAIVYDQQLFYVVAIDEGDNEFHRFRLDRIKALKLTKEKRTILRTDSQIEEYVKSTTEAIAGKLEEIEAICDNGILNAVIDRFGKNITIIKNDKDSFKLILDTNKDGFIYWALKNIRQVEVIKPEALRSEIKDILAEANKKYNSYKNNI